MFSSFKDAADSKFISLWSKMPSVLKLDPSSPAADACWCHLKVNSLTSTETGSCLHSQPGFIPVFIQCASTSGGLGTKSGIMCKLGSGKHFTSHAQVTQIQMPSLLLGFSGPGNPAGLHLPASQSASGVTEVCPWCQRMSCLEDS